MVGDGEDLPLDPVLGSHGSYSFATGFSAARTAASRGKTPALIDKAGYSDPLRDLLHRRVQLGHIDGDAFALQFLPIPSKTSALVTSSWSCTAASRMTAWSAGYAAATIAFTWSRTVTAL